jgi:hypothetical protein
MHDMRRGSVCILALEFGGNAHGAEVNTYNLKIDGAIVVIAIFKYDLSVVSG